MDHLGLDAIELIALHQAFQDGLTRDEARPRLVEQVSRYAPAAPREEHDAVADRILIELIAPHQLLIPARAPDGGLHQVVKTLRLLTEHQAAGGRIYLRAGAEAINVLIDRLDVDASSSAHAAELQMQFLVKNHRMAEAEDVAHAMRLLSVRYMEDTRRFLDAAQRNLDEVDWIDDVEHHLTLAHQHVQDRISAEYAIDAELQTALDAGAATDRNAVLGALRLIRQTTTTHNELIAQLAGVYEIFRAEQDRQRFTSRAASLRLADLRHDVLNGFMALTLGEAEALEPHPAQILLGAVLMPQITVAGLVDRTLAALNRDIETEVPVEDDEDFADEPDDSMRTELLPWLEPDSVNGRMLSEVLQDAREDLDDDRLRRLAAIGLEAFGAEHLGVLGGADEDDQAGVPGRFLLAVRVGQPIEVVGAPWLDGDDIRFIVVEQAREAADAQRETADSNDARDAA